MRNQPRPQVVVVTGASGGIGRAIAYAFAKRGAHLGLLARGQPGLEAAAEEVRSLGGRAIVIPTDMTDPELVEAAADAVEARFGSIDAWVNDAMATVFARVVDTHPEEFKRATEVTYLGTVYVTMTALRRMPARDRGVIVQVGSALAYRAIPLQAAYRGAKFAIRGFTDSIRTELLADHSHVQITMVQLPGVNTTQFKWCRAKLPRHPQPVPPIYQPEIPAEAVYWAAQHHRRELWVGLCTVQAIPGNNWRPGSPTATSPNRHQRPAGRRHARGGRSPRQPVRAAPRAGRHARHLQRPGQDTQSAAVGRDPPAGPGGRHRCHRRRGNDHRAFPAMTAAGRLRGRATCCASTAAGRRRTRHDRGPRGVFVRMWLPRWDSDGEQAVCKRG
jgi:short-subunit dehydrogenase